MKLEIRSHHCGELSRSDIGKSVSLCGWVHRRRDLGGLIFIDLRDRYGITQLLFDPEFTPDTHEKASRLRLEWAIHVRGKVIARTQPNPKLATGEIEIKVESLEIYSESKTPPFSICDETIDVYDELRLKYRYLDIRRGYITKMLQLRHEALTHIRDHFNQHHFTEVGTPILSKSTPEGARDYLVPSRLHEGCFYALPQSPQLYKQLLMISGMDRYYQIAQCFRDEDLRSDRQPEFTQVDIEMSFVPSSELLDIVEKLFIRLFKECLGKEIPTTFQKMTYYDAMEKYGTDRPDLRFGMPLVRVDEIMRRSNFSVFLSELDRGGCIKALCVKGGAEISRKEIDRYAEFVGNFQLSGLAWIKKANDQFASSIVKYFPDELLFELAETTGMENGDLLLMGAGPEDRVNQSLDHLRRHIAKEKNLIPEGAFKFLWVVDFPLFGIDSETGQLTSVHHPFTAPLAEDISLLETEPLKVRSEAYDLVLNGYELGGGSRRIHDTKLQEKIFRLLQLSERAMEQKFGFFLEALQYGTPPHLGIAFGLDRIIMLLGGTENIRDVIAFPKTQKATDLMMSTPSFVDERQLDELKIRTLT
jgi:aspartyl-tRNA synthetase